MISLLVKSAFQTGCLSVASEGMIRQTLSFKIYQRKDLEALAALNEAVNQGTIQREARGVAALTLVCR